MTRTDVHAHPHPRSHSRPRPLAAVVRRTAVPLAGLAGLALAAAATPDLMVVNESPSLPRGVYLRTPTPPVRGAVVAVPQPAMARAYLAELGVPAGLPLLKRVVAAEGDAVCADGRHLIAPLTLVRVRDRDRRGRPLPAWRGCRVLGPGELFVLGDTPASFDSRHFGPIRRDAVLGVYRRVALSADEGKPRMILDLDPDTAGRARLAATAVAAVAVLAGAPAAAQTPDWSRAGGGLFPEPAAGAASADPTATPPSDAAAVPVPEQPYGALIAETADRHGLDAKLLHALVTVESAYRPTTCSPAGACGLAQLMPGTARDLGVADRFDPVQNLGGGADYLARQLRRFGDLRLALAAYNSGPDRVARLGRVPDIAETRAYVAAVVDCYLALTAGRSVRSSRDCRAEPRP